MTSLYFLTSLIGLWSYHVGAVVELTDQNFYDYAKTKDVLLVDFYAPWCGDCKALDPDFESAASSLGTRSLDLAKVDCFGAGKATCDSFGIKRWPTLKNFNRGTYTGDYNGGLAAPDIVGYITNVENSITTSTNNMNPYAMVAPQPIQQICMSRCTIENHPRKKSRCMAKCKTSPSPQHNGAKKVMGVKMVHAQPVINQKSCAKCKIPQASGKKHPRCFNVLRKRCARHRRNHRNHRRTHQKHRRTHHHHRRTQRNHRNTQRAVKKESVEGTSDDIMMALSEQIKTKKMSGAVLYLHNRSKIIMGEPAVEVMAQGAQEMAQGAQQQQQQQQQQAKVVEPVGEPEVKIAGKSLLISSPGTEPSNGEQTNGVTSLGTETASSRSPDVKPADREPTIFEDLALKLDPHHETPHYMNTVQADDHPPEPMVWEDLAPTRRHMHESNTAQNKITQNTEQVKVKAKIIKHGEANKKQSISEKLSAGHHDSSTTGSNIMMSPKETTSIVHDINLLSPHEAMKVPYGKDDK